MSNKWNFKRVFLEMIFSNGRQIISGTTEPILKNLAGFCLLICPVWQFIKIKPKNTNLIFYWPKKQRKNRPFFQWIFQTLAIFYFFLFFLKCSKLSRKQPSFLRNHLIFLFRTCRSRDKLSAMRQLFFYVRFWRSLDLGQKIKIKKKKFFLYSTNMYLHNKKSFI